MKFKEVWLNLKKEENKSINRFVRKLFSIFVIVTVTIVFAAIIGLKNYDNLEKQALKKIEENILATKLENIQAEIKSVTSDLLMLSESSSLKSYLSNNSDKLKEVESEFYNMSKYHDIFDQVRLLNEEGMEVIRINFNSGKAKIIDKKDLQDKSDRYYFLESIKLNRNEVFISPLDLNIENGLIEKPHKPMLRFAVPAFNNQGRKKGVVIVNYFGQNIIKHFSEDKNPLIKGQLMFLNSEGYWFKGANSEYDWAFMFEDKKDLTFENLHGEAWDSIHNSVSSQFETKQGMFTFKTVNPIPKNLMPKSNISAISKTKDNYHWKIVSFIPISILNNKRNERIKIIAIVLSVLFVSWIFVFIQLVRNQYRILLSQEKLKNRELKLAELNATKDKLFSVIGHDLINPMNRIEGFSELLVEYAENEDYDNLKEYAGIIQKSSNKTMSLLSNLLDWSRSQIGGKKFKLEKYNLNKQINELFLLMTDVAERKSISLRNKAENNLFIAADKNMIGTVLRNLLSNAIKFTNRGGEIIVSAHKENSNTIIKVIDNGIGINKEHLKNLLEITENNSRAGTENEKGTGLGLVLCKEFISAHGGEIVIESEEGEGSCFKLIIPERDL